MNIKNTFLKLTEYTTPWGSEDDLVSILPNGVQRDRWGNYHLNIGNSKTIFT